MLSDVYIWMRRLDVVSASLLLVEQQMCGVSPLEMDDWPVPPPNPHEKLWLLDPPEDYAVCTNCLKIGPSEDAIPMDEDDIPTCEDCLPFGDLWAVATYLRAMELPVEIRLEVRY